MRVYRDILDTDGNVVKTTSVIDIMEATYSGKDMGERKIMATIKYPTPIDFRIGDYVVFQMQSLQREDGESRGSLLADGERFYIYTEPQCKKTARPMSVGDAFETTVTFYPRQYELSGIQMRDFLQVNANADQIMYTGFDSVSFYGGAHELLERCMACLAQHYKDKDGNPLWKYELADSLNEDMNNALERYSFSFSQNSVMDALMKLNDKDYINTTFFINGRTIYVGFKRPYLCSVDSEGAITNRPLNLMYGKTSDQPIDIDHGGLYDITKTVGDEMPITKLFAYGAARNLNRYYCADRIKSGRFVNRLMLPSFSDDGETDWIISEDGVKKYGIREGSKTFEEIYPSLRYMTYADIRSIKYCIKIKTSGLTQDEFIDGKMDHENSRSHYPVARVQCYKVEPCDGTNGTKIGVNKLVECAPPEDLAIFVHATGKTVKCILYGGATNEEAHLKQLEHDYKVPTRDGVDDWIPGACFCVHDNGFDGAYDKAERDSWFTEDATAIDDRDSNFHRIEYVDRFWLTDLYVFEDYEQRNFKRDGYSAWAYPHYNNDSGYPGSLLVNEVVAVEPVVIPDTSDNLSGGRQQHFDIYLRDVGFQIDEQNDFGEMVFVFNTPVVSVLDGILAGREFTIDGGENLNNFQERVICAYREDGSFNDDFMVPGDSNDDTIAARALKAGAMWRIRLNRNDNDEYLSSIGIVIPNTDIQMKAGDHIVLLDIFMPDIYVRAAEQRLLREARLYLEKNDKGTVKYAINFDKVRFNQIPNYALQMREGVILRMIDADLNITSDNVIRQLVAHDVPLANSVQLYRQQTIVDENTTDTSYTYGDKYISGTTHKDWFYDFVLVSANETTHSVSLRVPRLSDESTFESLKLTISGDVVVPTNQVAEADGDHYVVTCVVASDYYFKNLKAQIRIIMNVIENTVSATYNKIYPAGSLMPAICKDYISFKADKFYEVIVEVADAFWSAEHDDIVLTPAAQDIETRYSLIDELTGKKHYTCTVSPDVVDGFRRVKYTFRLPTSFNDAQSYYVALKYIADDSTDFSEIRMVSVTEKDLDENNKVVDYVDFLVSNVTIKLTDNTRPANIEDVEYVEVGNERERMVKSAPEPIYDISAQIEQQSKASTWGTIMNDIEKTRIEQEQTKRTYETLVNVARDNYQNLLNLKNNIFDPDGTCSDVFLQVMMLQVGADSMNYQLDKTMTTPTGVMSNFTVNGRDVQNDLYDIFHVYDMDVLHHFVYTKGAGNGGNWQLPGDFEKELTPIVTTDEGGNEKVTWPTYYVCLRCKKDNVNDLSQSAWMCTTDQYAVNQDKVPSTGSTTNEYGENVSDYWYFNWGILTADSDGHYTLQETRGNAYMYGDNIVCGKITTIAGNSYFDLTHGNFVLSQGDVEHASLSYIDGVLTIAGINDGSENSILERLGLIENEEIGGENLSILDNGEFYDIHESPNSGYIDGDIELLQTSTSQQVGLIRTYLDAGNYILTAKEVYGKVFSQSVIPVRDVTFTLRVFREGVVGVYKTVAIPQGDNIEVKVTSEYRCSFCIHYHYEITERQTVTMHLVDIMLQRGTKATNYQDYVGHLTDALHGSTQIAGGVTMTNLLLLKDENENVNAGMSGLHDENLIGSFGDGSFSEGVTLFSGGTYEEALAQAMGLYGQLSQLLPVLITKTGIHTKIGPFEVISNTAVSITNQNGSSIIIDAEKGISMLDANGNTKFELLPQNISLDDIFSFRQRLYFERSIETEGVRQNDDTPTRVLLSSSALKIPSTGSGNYMVKLAGFAIWMRAKYVYTTTYGHGGRRTHTEYITNEVPLDYSIYLQRTTIAEGPVGDKYYLTGENGGITYRKANINSGSLVVNDNVTFNNMPEGEYYVYMEYTSPYNFAAKYYSHKYEISIANDMEAIGVDSSTDTGGKVVIGLDGLLVSAGNSTYALIKSEEKHNRLDFRLVGLPKVNDWPVDYIPSPGEVYYGSDGNIKIVTSST